MHEHRPFAVSEASRSLRGRRGVPGSLAPMRPRRCPGAKAKRSRRQRQRERTAPPSKKSGPRSCASREAGAVRAQRVRWRTDGCAGSGHHVSAWNEDDEPIGTIPAVGQFHCRSPDRMVDRGCRACADRNDVRRVAGSAGLWRARHALPRARAAGPGHAGPETPPMTVAWERNRDSAEGRVRRDTSHDPRHVRARGNGVHAEAREAGRRGQKKSGRENCPRPCRPARRAARRADDAGTSHRCQDLPNCTFAELTQASFEGPASASHFSIATT